MVAFALEHEVEDRDEAERFVSLMRSMDNVYLARGERAGGGRSGEPRNSIETNDRRGLVGLLSRLARKAGGGP
jgi:hypothetical protein